MKVFCVYCGDLIREIDDCQVEGDSHGICQKCLAIEKEKMVQNLIKTRGISREAAEELVEGL